MQLPNAASLERTGAAARDVEKILANTPGVQYTTSVSRLQLAELRPDQLQRLLFCHAEALGRPRNQSGAVSGNQGAPEPAAQQASRREPFSASRRRPFPESALPADFSSCSKTVPGGTFSFWQTTWHKFLAAARKRPEIGLISSTFLPSVPQQFVHVDRDKVLKQGVAISDVYQTIQAFMGGLFVNYFNDFGRTWQVYVEAEAPYRSNADEPRAVLRAQQPRGNGAAFRAGEVRVALRPRIHHALQRIPVGADQRQRRAGLQLGPGHGGPGRCLQADHAARNGLRLYGHVLSGAEGAARSPGFGHLRVLAVVRLSDSGGAL